MAVLIKTITVINVYSINTKKKRILKKDNESPKAKYINNSFDFS